MLFFTNFAYANLYINNIPDGCNFYDTVGTMSAWFEPNTHTCNAGYYVPANYDGCQKCLSGHTCTGGTFLFDENNNHGIFYATLFAEDVQNGCDTALFNDGGYFFASFEPNQHICNTGYYMPANYDGCIICPTDSYCPGGTYTFNTTIPQGIVSCDAGLFAPSGMWESAQCGRILHVGDGFVYLRATKKTSPSLHLDLDHDGVADYFGNMTTLDVPMSRDTQRKLKVRYNNTTYSIYDDSVELPTE